MALTINYSTFIINVPKTYTTFVEINPNTGLEIRQMSIETFAKDLADIQDNDDDVWAPTAYEWTQPKDVGGIQLAPVFLILSPYTITFEDGQYAVNLIGGNTNLQDFANVNQVSIRPSNSVGSTYSDSINSQSFTDARVWVDTSDGETGTAFPIGTPSRPSNNLTDTLSIAVREKLHRFYFDGNITASGNIGILHYNVLGSTPLSSIINASNLVVDNSSFERVSLVGSTSGRGSFTQCSLAKTLGWTGAQGIIDNCGIAGNITLDSAATEPIVFKDCVSAIAGTAKPGLNCNATQAGINFRRYTGGLAITNFSHVNGTMTLDLMGSEVSINSTNCTNGVLVARGVGKLTDENGIAIPTGTSTINGNLLVSNRLINADQLLWSTAERDEVLQYSKKASDNAEQANLKL